MTSSVVGLLKLDRASVEGLRVKALRTNSMLSDDEPLYDSVASDEDYASIGDNHSAKGIKMDDKQPDVGHILSSVVLLRPVPITPHLQAFSVSQWAGLYLHTFPKHFLPSLQSYCIPSCLL